MNLLPQVTLVAIDGTKDPSATYESFLRAAKQVQFGATLFIATAGHSNMVIPRLDKDGYNRYCLRQLHKHIKTSHCLTVQSDSGINNPDAWDDSWLQWDYIGAPWPLRHGGHNVRVGNSGFCLRSKRLLEATSKVVKDDGCHWNGKRIPACLDDVVTCIMYREQLVKLGIKFAPVEVAAKFAFEQAVPEAKVLDGQFGFHTKKP